MRNLLSGKTQVTGMYSYNYELLILKGSCESRPVLYPSPFVQGTLNDTSIMQFPEIHILIDRYLSGQATEEEMQLVEDWYASFEHAPGLLAMMTPRDVQQAQTRNFSCILYRLGLPNREQ